MSVRAFVLCYMALSVLTGCTTVLYKQKAVDMAALAQRLPDSRLLQPAAGGEQVLSPDEAWLSAIKPQKQLTFIGITGETDHAFGALLEIDLNKKYLRYLPLPSDETPLSILNNPENLITLRDIVQSWPSGSGRFGPSFTRTIPLTQIHERLAAPIPPPKQIVAVAANYPSHLFNDLALSDNAQLIGQLRQARPRIFQKYPPVSAPVETSVSGKDYFALPGPFDSLSAPEQVHVPTLSGQTRTVSGHLDYEVEIAVLIRRDLNWEQVRSMDDHQLRGTVAGYLLFSDAKVRDPQVMGKILHVIRDREVLTDDPYRIGDKALDGTLGPWDETTCHWWSYAASWGRYAAHGPFFVSSAGHESFSPRLILSARSYSSSADRPQLPPDAALTDRLLLRQAAVTTISKEYRDALVWDVPAIVRSLLDPAGNALAFSGTYPVLNAGDLIALGTPGGTVISAKPWWLLPIAEDLLFWKDPEDFYKMFFAPAENNYLYPGDELFLWGEGLGYQHHRVVRPEDEQTRSDE
ncbi:MAG: fumarylacetoacetate hydrolase family protein [Deltaproteobacteria bacterium]|nr:fumarylacetoacetate hydrolase family protein [Deltaproteobacteria bacterium]